MIKILCLDIEGTIVDDWFNFNVLQENVDAIKSFIKKNNFDRVAFFTYAFWSNVEVNDAHNSHKLSLLSKLLDIPYLKDYHFVYTKSSVIRYAECRGSSYSLEEELKFNDRYRTKQEAFINMARGMQYEDLRKGCISELEITLIDDTNTEDFTAIFHSQHLKIHFKTFDTIKKEI